MQEVTLMLKLMLAEGRDRRSTAVPFSAQWTVAEGKGEGGTVGGWRMEWRGREGWDLLILLLHLLLQYEAE